MIFLGVLAKHWELLSSEEGPSPHDSVPYLSRDKTRNFQAQVPPHCTENSYTTLAPFKSSVDK